MVVPHESLPDHNFVDQRTWTRIVDASIRLVNKRQYPYFLDDSDFGLEEAFQERPNQQIGDKFEHGSLGTGLIRLFVLNQAGIEIAEAAGEENLKAQLTFARQNQATHFSGDLRFYGYESGEGEIAIRAEANIDVPDPDLNFEYSVLASQVGLSRIWRKMSSNPTDPLEARIEQNADMRTGQDIARALVTLDRHTSGP
jgi:hypothetical protein